MNDDQLIGGSLAGKNAVVTGGSRGVGRAVSLLLGRAGARVAVGYRNRADEADAVVRALRDAGTDGVAVAGDMSDPAAVIAVFDRAEAALGPLDLVVVNHGIWPPDDVPIAAMSDEQWRRTLAVNLDGAFYACREAARRVRDDGRIVLIGSTAGQRGEAMHGDYAASKGALISLVKGFCVELAPRGITVNCVAPGWVDTEMAEGALRAPGGDDIAR